MKSPRGLRVKDGDVVLLIGTTKGAFLLGSTATRLSAERSAGGVQPPVFVLGPHDHRHAVAGLRIAAAHGVEGA